MNRDIANRAPSGGELELDAHLVARRDDFTIDIELAVRDGETAALLGPNGAGKSTVVDALAGLLPLDHGHIRLGQRTLDEPRQQLFVPPDLRRVGVVFQDYLLFEHLSVVDNVAFGLTSTGTRAARARAGAREWIDRLELNDFADRKPSELSGGQAQRVALARALASEPDLLLLDEPLAALDITTRAELRRTLASHLRSYDGPRLLITHDPADAFLLADQIFVIEQGRITQSGSSNDIRQRPATEWAAALAGTNLLSGNNEAGVLTLADHPQTLLTADTHTAGPVLITIHPAAVALHLERPHGSPRNSWLTSVATVEPLGDTTRLSLADPLPIAVDITPAATAALGLRVGSPIWASVKATEIAVQAITSPG